MKALLTVLVAFIIGAIAVPPCYEIYGNLPAPLPGIDLIGLGYDTVNDKPALCIVKLTYSGDTITSPYDNRTYSIPDGVQTIKTPNVFNTTTNTLFNTTEEYREDKANRHNVSLSFGDIASYTNSKEYHLIADRLSHSEMQLNIIDQTHIFFNVQLHPPALLDLSPVAAASIARLPFYSNTSQAQYFQFFKYFGTYYVSQADLGGSLRMRSFVNVTDFKDLNAETLARQFGIKFKFETTPPSNKPYTEGPAPSQDPTTDVKSNTILNKPNQKNFETLYKQIKISDPAMKRAIQQVVGITFEKMREEYKQQLNTGLMQQSETYLELKGGLFTKYTPENWRDWDASIPSAPVYLNVQLQSIVDIVPSVLRASFTQAIQDYLSTPPTSL
eukprot:TRINITY_DN12685_c0_g1_i1.p1 TRINITY_DN12685_c0_g1~~TRINITY_DN12685_c0_g1_i1.p1  ORF type:complete len:393 (+),score=107.42 TRINITY_DN12685_c0_g1_i1:23-1180(+)